MEKMGKKQDKKHKDEDMMSESDESDFESVDEAKPKLNRKKNTKSTKKREKPKKKIQKKKSQPKTEKGKETKSDNPKKQYYLSGQKHPTPYESDGTRIFYESLLNQDPNSIMAQKFCLEYGILSESKIEEVQNNLKKLINKNKK